MLEKEMAPAGKDYKEKKISQMAGIGPEKVIITNLERSLEVWWVVGNYQDIWGGQTADVLYTGGF